jgi:hypothetical protein
MWREGGERGEVLSWWDVSYVYFIFYGTNRYQEPMGVEFFYTSFPWVLRSPSGSFTQEQSQLEAVI